MFSISAYGQNGTDHATDETAAVRVGPQGVTVEYRDGSTMFLAEGELELRIVPPALEDPL